MGLFGNKKPRLPNYVGFNLDALLQDPEWAHAISQAGIDIRECEIVLRLAEATIGTGMGATPANPRPAVLLGQGATLAMAFPNEREVIVVKRNKAKAELQTQRSGWFQILFGPVDRLDAFMFWGAQDNLKLDTPEGAIFGKVMAAFLQGHLKPQQFVGTPQTLVAGGVSLEPPTPEFDDPEDALRWRALLSVDASLAALLEKYQECYETAEKVEKAFGLADSGYVNGVRQHEYSVAAFREMGARQEGVLVDLLKELREVTHQAVAQWNNLLFLLPDAPNDILKISNWCSSRGVDSEVMSRVVGNGMYQFTNFGLTRKSFWAENARVIAVSNGAGQ